MYFPDSNAKHSHIPTPQASPIHGPYLPSTTDMDTDMDDLQLYCPDYTVSVELRSFTDLKTLVHFPQPNTLYKHGDNPTPEESPVSTYGKKRRLDKKHLKQLQFSYTAMDRPTGKISNVNIPASIRNTIENSHMLDILMNRAVSHWCCIGFKVAPLQIEAIRDWHTTPLPIVYCVAAISLVTFIDRRDESHFAGLNPSQKKNSSLYAKAAAMVFYEKCYFCLSYVSNLLRLADQQRAWAHMASLALIQSASDIKGGKKVDESTMLCWYRWYYIDVWMSLTRNTKCLLPDDLPLPFLEGYGDLLHTPNQQDIALQNRHTEKAFDCLSLYQLGGMAKYMRRFVHALRSGDLFDISLHGAEVHLSPSPLYHGLNNEVQGWYEHQPHASQVRPSFKVAQNSPSAIFCPRIDIHTHLCYHSMRLVILYQFFQPEKQISLHVLIDCLETNLTILQALQHLREIGCDQSTYHIMFFAVHNAAKHIYQYTQTNPSMSFLLPFAKEQLHMNLSIICGTFAYENDIFMLQNYVEIFEQDLNMGIPISHKIDKTRAFPQKMVFRLESQMNYLSRRSKQHTPLPTYVSSKQAKGTMGRWKERIKVPPT
ncbi:hypothetical protein BDF14DRAFT_1783672 [Spinellus fusiger]|nr:hypothetical protein BDF14DRAFT_1783672 [Spinellus fusiger]